MVRFAPNYRLVCAVLLLACAPGCATLYSNRPLVVQVRDIETKKPLPQAEVHITYPLADSPFAPPNSSATTGEDGIARLQAAPYGDAGVVIAVNAGKHIRGEKFLSVAEVQALEPAHFFEKVEQRPVNVVVELYAEPRPAIELVVPVGFKGTVKAEIHVQDDAPCVPGQRVFSGEMLPSRVVPIIGPPLLHVVPLTDFRARFADGGRISSQPKGEEIGLWLMSSEGADRFTFYVGSHEDYQRFNLFSNHEISGDQRSSGGRSGGGGRGGHGGRHGGGSSGSDSGSDTTPTGQ